MTKRIRFSVNLINLSPKQLEEVVSNYEYDKQPKMQISNARKVKGPRKIETGLLRRVSRKSEYRIIKKSYSEVRSHQMIKACQALIKLKSLQNRNYNSVELRKWLSDQKAVANVGAGSSMITRLRRQGFLELVDDPLD